MAERDPRVWMWSEAVAVLTRAERLHGHFFQPAQAPARPSSAPPAWEPPIDVLETAREVMILIALPGVGPDGVETAIEDGALVVAGRRVLPPELRTAVIHRLELPQGRFERRIPLPPGRYDAVRRTALDGCLLITLRKAA